ncbi:MAG TPA: FtsW/RodA/SpoVE family cell cycle protein [Dehalococcoidia bacterium]|nr:FtsW/RodA/SpoVE family cell cycle protein [Dehalococcoidia bacterium]
MLRSLRFTELSLLLAPCLVLLAGLWLLGISAGRTVAPTDLRPGFIVIALIVTSHFVLVVLGVRGDQVIFPVSVMLAGIGFVMVQRLGSSDLAFRQSIWTALGFGVLLLTVVLLRDPNVLARYKYSFAVAGLLLTAVTFVLGSDPNGSGQRLWIVLGPVQFQPSEILKVLLVVFLAGYLDTYREILVRGRQRLLGLQLPPIPYLIPLLIMWVLTLAILVVQRDLGAALLFFFVFLIMLYIASAKSYYFWIGLVAFLIAAYLAYQVVSVFQLRVDIWLDPWRRASAEGYQLVQGLIAFGTGGVFGEGLGYGSPDVIPAVHTDFVLAAIGEELGLLGTLGVVLLYIVLVYRGFRLALTTPDSFRQLLAAGLSTVLGLQCLIILGGTTRLIPLTGITMPFISYGGSSLLTNFLIIGLLLRLSSPITAEA